MRAVASRPPSDPPDDPRYLATVDRMLRSQAWRERGAAARFEDALPLVPEGRWRTIVAGHVAEERAHYARVAAVWSAAFGKPPAELDAWVTARLTAKPLPRVTIPDFDYKAQPTTKLEVPLKERLAKLREQRSGERARSKAKQERRPSSSSAQPARQSESRPARSGDGRPAASGGSSGGSGRGRRGGSGRPGGSGRAGGGRSSSGPYSD